MIGQFFITMSREYFRFLFFPALYALYSALYMSCPVFHFQLVLIMLLVAVNHMTVTSSTAQYVSSSLKPVGFPALVSLLVVVPVLEEVVFRVIVPAHLELFLPLFSVPIVACLVFGLVHINNVTSLSTNDRAFMNVTYMAGRNVVMAFLLGCILSMSVTKTTGFLQSIVLHGLYNSMVLMIFVLGYSAEQDTSPEANKNS